MHTGFELGTFEKHIIHCLWARIPIQVPKRVFQKKPRPEVRDDLDSRKNKEIGFTGDISKKGDKKKKE